MNTFVSSVWLIKINEMARTTLQLIKDAKNLAEELDESADSLREELLEVLDTLQVEYENDKDFWKDELENEKLSHQETSSELENLKDSEPEVQSIKLNLDTFHYGLENGNLKVQQRVDAFVNELKANY